MTILVTAFLFLGDQVKRQALDERAQNVFDNLRLPLKVAFFNGDKMVHNRYICL